MQRHRACDVQMETKGNGESASSAPSGQILKAVMRRSRMPAMLHCGRFHDRRLFLVPSRRLWWCRKTGGMVCRWWGEHGDAEDEMRGRSETRSKFIAADDLIIVR